MEKTIREFTKLSNGGELDIQYPVRLYDKDGKQVYHETSYGCWWKREYDADGKEVYFETESGYWHKSEYENGKQVYCEDSTGYIDDRRELVDLTMEDIYKLVGKKVRIV